MLKLDHHSQGPRQKASPIIEHNLDIIKTTDWRIDRGLEGGSAEGRLVAEMAPETVAKVRKSHTGGYLREMVTAK